MLETHRIGREGHPVMVIDDFAPDVAGLLDTATKQSFAVLGPYYPGIRAHFPGARIDQWLEPYQQALQENFESKTTFSTTEVAFSLVTTAPSSLAPIQRLPHVDGTDPMTLAVLVYLSGCDVGGTAFYRHRQTGYERVDQARYASYAAALQQDVAAHGLPDAAYVTADTPLFEQIAVFGAVPGRALIYSGTSLHSGMILTSEHLSADPAQGRLTINAFVKPICDSAP